MGKRVEGNESPSGTLHPEGGDLQVVIKVQENHLIELLIFLTLLTLLVKDKHIAAFRLFGDFF